MRPLALNTNVGRLILANLIHRDSISEVKVQSKQGRALYSVVLEGFSESESQKKQKSTEVVLHFALPSKVQTDG